MRRVEIKKNDILKAIYFITAITQKQQGTSMQGALSSKGDLMGGIFDRWINTVPEGILFNNIILPDISDGKDVEIITDFYLYDPKTAGIAPDVIGIKVDDRIIPFVLFNERWETVNNMPQIEVKTYKKPQKMVSLRNQNYDDKYFVMAESEFRIDYLLPFFSSDIFDDEIYERLHMNDTAFIVSNTENRIHQTDQVDVSNDSIGAVTLLKITNARAYMDNSTLCEGNVSVQYLTGIDQKRNSPRGELLNTPISHYCEITDCGLYRFNENWYEGVTEQNVPYYTKRTRGGNIEFLYRTLDISIENIQAIKVLKKSMSSMYIKTEENASINGFPLDENSIYKIDFQLLDRSSNDGEEYFMQKNLLQFIPDFEEELKNTLSQIIREEN